MSKRPLTLPFVPRDSRSPLRIEVQRLDRRHPNVRFGPHAHTFLEIMLVTGGRGVHGHGDAAYQVCSGDVFAIAPGEVHDCSELGSAEGWLVLFCADAVSDRVVGGPWRADPRWGAFLRAGGHNGHVRLAGPEMDEMAERIRSLRNELLVPGVGHALRVGAIVDLLLLDLSRHVGGAPDAGGPGILPGVVGQVLAIIDERFASPISLATVARDVGRSRSHLTEIVRRATGQTVGQWIIERRLAEARHLLTHTDLPVQGVAERVGYVDTSHFIRQFVRATGRAPGAWRRAARTPGNLPTETGDLR